LSDAIDSPAGPWRPDPGYVTIAGVRAITLALIFVGCATTSPIAATDFFLRDLEGRDVHLSDYTGQVVLLAFFASWSRPSQSEIPHLERLYRAYRERGFVVLGVAIDGPETISAVPLIANRYGVSFPVLYDHETKVVAIYNPKRSTPLSILMDRAGAIVWIREGYNTGDETWIESDLRKLLDR
jgi:peroxiredoxin